MKSIEEIHEEFSYVGRLCVKCNFKIFLVNGLEARVDEEKKELFIEQAEKLLFGMSGQHVCGIFNSYSLSNDNKNDIILNFLYNPSLKLSGNLKDFYPFKLKLNQIEDYEFLSMFHVE